MDDIFDLHLNKEKNTLWVLLLDLSAALGFGGT